MGGILFLLGALIMVYNLWRTIRGDIAEPATVAAAGQPAITPAE
jgi:cytochrome c oxidase cbb3-type subunit 1